MNWYLAVLKKYADFKGRARRKEYWMYTLFQILFGIVAMMLDGALGLTVGLLPYGFIYLAYTLATFIPSLAVTCRRLHDTSKSGWMFLIVLIPIVGAIWLLVLMCLDSTPGTNKWGPNPKNEQAINNEALDSHLAR